MIYKYKYLIYFVILILVFWGRYFLEKEELPSAWSPGEKVRITALVKEESYQSGSKCSTKLGRFYVKNHKCSELSVGQRVVVVSTPLPQVIGKKTVRIELIDPLILQVPESEELQIGWWDRVQISLVLVRQKMVKVVQNYLPEPHAGLALGILLGWKATIPQDFYDALVGSGTLHTVAASGYNVNLVMKVIMGVTILFFSRRWALLAGFLVVVTYVVMAGGSPAVVRSAVMGILAYSAYYWGREAEAKRLLWVAAYLMLIVDPLLVWDIGFQLSVAATAGILYIEPLLRKLSVAETKLGDFLKENLYPTLAAGVMTTPLIYYHFGRISWVTPLSNLLVLGVVPAIMTLTAITIVVGLLWSTAGRLVAMLLYLPLEFFVRVVERLGS